MSEFRRQIEAARAQYLATAYPGDLADELLPPARRSGWRRFAAVVGAIGSVAAAAVAVLVFRMMTLPATDPDQGPYQVARVDRPPAVAKTPRMTDVPAVAKGDEEPMLGDSPLSVPESLPTLVSRWVPDSISPGAVPRPSELPGHVSMIPPIDRISPPGLPRMPSLRGLRSRPSGNDAQESTPEPDPVSQEAA